MKTLSSAAIAWKMKTDRITMLLLWAILFIANIVAWLVYTYSLASNAFYCHRILL